MFVLTFLHLQTCPAGFKFLRPKGKVLHSFEVVIPPHEIHCDLPVETGITSDKDARGSQGERLILYRNFVKYGITMYYKCIYIM